MFCLLASASGQHVRAAQEALQPVRHLQSGQDCGRGAAEGKAVPQPAGVPAACLCGLQGPQLPGQEWMNLQLPAGAVRGDTESEQRLGGGRPAFCWRRLWARVQVATMSARCPRALPMAAFPGKGPVSVLPYPSSSGFPAGLRLLSGCAVAVSPLSWGKAGPWGGPLATLMTTGQSCPWAGLCWLPTGASCWELMCPPHSVCSECLSGLGLWEANCSQAACRDPELGRSRQPRR